MFSTVAKVNKTVSVLPQKSAGTFFRKAGEPTFFDSKNNGTFFSNPIQAKLRVSSPDDPQEKEADAVADKVMRIPDPVITPSPVNKEEEKLHRQQAPKEPTEMVKSKKETPARTLLSRKEQAPEELAAKLQDSNNPAFLQRSEEEKQREGVYPKLIGAAVRPMAKHAGTAINSADNFNRNTQEGDEIISVYPSAVIQCAGRGPPETSSSFEQNLAASKGAGNPLPDSTRTFMESRFNADFSHVRVHTNAGAQQMSRQVQAHAFTHANDIYFNNGKYSPETSAGKTLLAHELTHTIQQGASPAGINVAAKKQNHFPFGIFVHSLSIDRKLNDVVPQYNLAPNIIQASTAYVRSGGFSLTSEAREYFEDSLKADVSDIRIHSDFESAMLARSRGVPAFVEGHHVVFDPSRYAPDTEEGGILLANKIAESLRQRSINVPGLSAQLSQGINEVKSGGNRPTGKTSEPDKKNLLVSKDKKKSRGKDKAGKRAKKKTVPEKKKGKAEKPDAFSGKTPKPNPKKSPSAPEEDPAFFKVVKNAHARAKDQKKHDAPVTKAAHAQQAAKAVPDEAQSAAKKRKTEGMDEVAKEDKAFDDESFKADLLKKIEEVTPKKLEAVTEFKENNKIGDVKSAMGQKVVSEKEKTAGPVEQATQQPLQVNDADNKQSIPLPPTPKGNFPQSIGAKDAAPKPKLDSEISMEKESQSLDTEMKTNNVTEDQLAKSNEPSFTNALKEKKAAQKDAKEKPKLFRKTEAQELKSAQAASNADASKSMMSMFSTRGKDFDGVVKQQQTTKSKDEQARAEVVAKIQGMYQQTEATVTALLTTAETSANSIFDAGSEKARVDFENYVDSEMRAYKRRRYSGFWGGLRWGKDKLFGMPDGVNKFYTVGRQRYLDQMTIVITKVAQVITSNLNAAKQAIKNGKKQIADYVGGLQDTLKNVGAEAAENIQDKFDSLEQSVNDKRQQLVDGLARKYVDNLKKLDDRITELKEANKGLVAKAIGLLKEVWKVIKNLYELFKTILSRIASVIGLIIDDPGKFFDNLGAAFKQGFDRFKNRIGEHLENGLMAWLSSQLGVANLQLPDKFDVSAIFGLVLQVLGVTYENIRERAVILIGEERVALMEKTVETGADIFQRIKRGGLGAIWEMIKEKLTDFKDMIWEAIKTFIKEAVVKAAITFILSLLNPVAAFVKACMAIYQFIMMLVRMKDRIIDLLNSILDAVAMIAAGSVDKAAAAVEMAFAKSIPIIIGFLAALLGLNDIGSKVKGIMLRIKEKVNKVIDWILNKAYSIVRPVVEAAMRVKNKGKEMYEKGKAKATALVEKGKEKARAAVGGGGTPEERLENGLEDAQRAVNKYAGKRVGALVLKPLLGVIKLKYGFQSLELVADGPKWAIEGQVNPKSRISTEVPVDIDSTDKATGAPHIKTGLVGKVILGSQKVIADVGGLHEQSEGGPDFAYVGNVPTTPSKDPAAIANQYMNEGFSDRNDAKARFSLVIGLNTYEDLEGKNLPKLNKSVKWDGFPLGVFSFYWQPYWSDGKTDITFEKMKDIFSKSTPDEKTAIINAEKRDAVNQKVIPIGEIRNLILTHSFTQKFTKALKQKKRNVYIHTGDDDAVTLKVEASEGFKIDANKIATHLFERYDSFLKNAGEDLPVIASGGYRFRIPIPGGYDVSQRNLTTIASDLDMAIRSAMARINPRAVYFPEPNTIIKVDGANLTAIFSGGGGEGERMVTKMIKQRGGGIVAFDERLAIVTDSARFDLDRGGTGETMDSKGTLKKLNESQIESLFNQAQSHARANTWEDRMVIAYLTDDEGKQRSALTELRKTLFPNIRFGYDPEILKAQLPNFNPHSTPFPPNLVKDIAPPNKRAEALQITRSTAQTIKDFLMSLIIR